MVWGTVDRKKSIHVANFRAINICIKTFRDMDIHRKFCLQGQLLALVESVLTTILRDPENYPSA